jgi:hypothetical protein
VILPLVLGCTDKPEPSTLLQVEEIVAPRTCADAAARDTLGPWERVELGADWVFAPDYHTPQWDMRRGARGVVVADLDGDGHLDLVAPQVLEPTRLLLGDGTGRFEPAQDRLPPLPKLVGPSGGSAGDLDGDGDLDLFLYGQESSAVVLVNDGTGTFSGTEHPEWDGEFEGCGGSASWGDMDGDGDLDVYFGRLGMQRPTGPFFCGSRLLRNDGGALVDASDQLPFEATQMRVLASGFLQLDGDPEPELYQVVDAVMEDEGGATLVGSNLLLDRVGDRFEALSGTGLEVVTAGMGLAAGDPNGDGVIDVMVPGVDELKVMMSVGPGVLAWADASQSTGLSPGPGQHSGWGGEWEDVDYDGLLDLVVTYGAFATPTVEPDEIYLNAGDGTWTAVGADWGFADGFPSRGFVLADLNEDGWLDVVKRELGGVVVLYLSRCGDAHHITVSLGGEDGNPHAIGAEVRVHAQDRQFVRYLTAGSTSYQTGGPPVAHIGLGEIDEIDEIEVIWPGGERGQTGPVQVDGWVHLER